MEKILIMMPIFDGNKTDYGSIINVGIKKGDFIEFETKDGIKKMRESDFVNPLFISCINNIDFNKSLYYWKRKTGNYNNIVIDYSIETGEVYRGNCWHFELMINTDDKHTTKVKPII